MRKLAAIVTFILCGCATSQPIPPWIAELTLEEIQAGLRLPPPACHDVRWQYSGANTECDALYVEWRRTRNALREALRQAGMR